MEPHISIGRELAIKIHDSKIYQSWTSEQIVRLQLFTKELCVPFELFQTAIEKCLGYSVFTHQFVTQYDNLVKDFLKGNPKPTQEEILNFIPESIKN